MFVMLVISIAYHRRVPATALPDDLDLLVALDVLLEERHVTRAARRLGVTQGAASQRLARLRDYFADPLLVAGRPRLVLTPRAEAVRLPLARALADLRSAVAAGAPFDAKRSERRFVLLGNDLLEARALPMLFRLFAAEAPRLAIAVERVDADFVSRLEQGTADLAFVPDFLVPGSLRRRALPDEPFVVLLRASHPLLKRRRRKAALTLPEYLALEHILIAPRGMPGSLVDGLLQAGGHQRRVVASIQTFVAAPLLVLATELAVTCPASLAKAIPKEMPVAALAPPFELGLDRTSVVWHERSQSDAGHAWLRGRIDWILSANARGRRRAST